MLFVHFKSGCKDTTSFANEQTTYINQEYTILYIVTLEKQ